MSTTPSASLIPTTGPIKMLAGDLNNLRVEIEGHGRIALAVIAEALSVMKAVSVQPDVEGGNTPEDVFLALAVRFAALAQAEGKAGAS